jgi:hypothetical protein
MELTQMIKNIGKNKIIYFALPIIVLFIIWMFYPVRVTHYVESNQYPLIFPDYQNITISQNIAPLNFKVMTPGKQFQTRVFNSAGQEIFPKSKGNLIDISLRQWKKLLANTLNDSIYFEVLVKSDDRGWIKFKDFSVFISPDKIDPFVVYRSLKPSFEINSDMALRQRDIESFDDFLLVDNRDTKDNCFNCHTFCKNDPNTMFFHVRINPKGTLFYRDGKLTNIDLKTPYTMSAGGYGSWHPGGKHIALSVNIFYQTFFANAYRTKEVFDKASDIIVYDIDKNMVTTSPKISTVKRENLPSWSPDGKYIYYVSGNEYSDTLSVMKYMYDLMRISYDINSNTWGDPEMVLDHDSVKMSLSFPFISPDGKFLLFNMVDFGYFVVNNRTSDLYLMDMTTGKYFKPSVNSNESDSYHTWSSNSRWVLFSSRRLDGISSRSFIFHIDSNGVTTKPFLLPLKDPGFYTNTIYEYNRPELITGKINLTFRDLKPALYEKPEQSQFDTSVELDALSGATRFEDKPIH